MNFDQVSNYIKNVKPKGWTYRLLTHDYGIVYYHRLDQVVTAVVSQLIEGKTVVVMPPILDPGRRQFPFDTICDRNIPDRDIE